MRRTASGEVLAPQEALTMEEAIRLYTQGSAYLSFDEHRNGTIEPGKRADFTVMAADPRQVDIEQVPDIPIVMTVVGGEIVHSDWITGGQVGRDTAAFNAKLKICISETG